MGYRQVPFAVGEFYHVYNRGNSKQVIFSGTEEYQRFQQLLYVANGTRPFEFRYLNRNQIYTQPRGDALIAIGAYCLMPNHFHILLTPKVENGVEEFMRKLSTAYSMYFNKKHERTGALFEGRFKAEHVSNDRYLKYLFSYIHLNPMKLQESNLNNAQQKMEFLLANLRSYKYSSYQDRIATRPESPVLSLEDFPDYFSEKGEFDKEIVSWLTYRAEGEK